MLRDKPQRAILMGLFLDEPESDGQRKWKDYNCAVVFRRDEGRVQSEIACVAYEKIICDSSVVQRTSD